MTLRLHSTIESELTLKKSVFITTLVRVKTADEVQTLLKNLRKDHPKASHVCHAYRLESKEGSSDDGEPSGTAGLPMLEALRLQDMQEICAVVVRYYGGIPLGASGLTKAYRKCVHEALSKAKKLKRVQVKQLTFEVDIDLADLLLERGPRLGSLVDRQFGERLRMTLQSEKDISDALNALTKGRITFISVEQVWIEKPIN